MKKKMFLAVCLFLGFSVAAFGQTTPPPAPTPKPPDIMEGAWNVSVNGGYSNISNAPTNNGFVSGVSLRLSQHLNLRSDVYLLNSPQGMVLALAGPEYRFSLAHVLKSSSYAASADRVEAFFNVGAGDAHTSTVTVDQAGNSITSVSKSKFAWSVGGGFDIKMSDTVTLRPLDIKYVRSTFLNQGGGVYGNQLAFAAGLGLRF